MSDKGEMPQEPNASETPAVEEKNTPAEQNTETVTLAKAEYDKVLKALKDANAEAAKRRKELDEKAKAEMTEAERLKKDLETAQAERLALLRERVAAKHGLPDALANRLQGMTQEEMEADAAELAKALPKPAPKSPGPVAPNPSDKPGLTMEQIRAMTPAEINKRWDEVQAALSKFKSS